MTVKLSRVQQDDHTTRIVTEVDAGTRRGLSADETKLVVESLVINHQLSMNDTKRQHMIERVLLRLGMDVEGLEVLHNH